MPPPPPGSAARKALEDAIVETSTPLPRPKPPTGPPPIPVAARGTPKSGSAHAPGTTAGTRAPSVIVDEAIAIPEVIPPTLPSPPPVQPLKLAVPVGEFDSGIQTLEEDKLRATYQHSTVVRDAADALLKIPVGVQLGEVAAQLRGDPTASDPKTGTFTRGDPTTVGDRDDATRIEGPSISTHAPSGTLRATAALRRKRGLIGDVYYVSTVLFGVRRSRRELAALEQRQQVRQTSRRHHLVTLSRTAVTVESFDHPALGKAREALAGVEDERSKHAGAVAAADSELERVRRDRAGKAKQYIEAVAALDAELATLGRQLDPLEKEIAAAKKRAGEVQDALKRIDRQLASTQASLHSVKAEKMDRAAIQAEIATLKADRQAVKRDEPEIAAELDALNPRLAAIEAARTEAQKKKRELELEELEDQRRSAELLDAIGAKRKVVDRAAGEAESARDKVLFELGERLYVDRPQILAAQLSPIDQIDLELGESDRRVMELREILSNVDKAKLARGAAVIFLALVAIGTFLGWLIYMLV